MRLHLAFAVSILALALPSCGDKGGSGGGGGSGPVGTWVLDTATTLKDALDEAEAEMTQRLEVVPAEHRDAAKKEVAQQIEMMRAGMTVHEGTLTIQADKTFSVSMFKGGQPGDTLSGTWTEAGDTITLTHTTKNGKPTTGNDAEPDLSLTLRGGLLVSAGNLPGPKFTFKRK